MYIATVSPSNPKRSPYKSSSKGTALAPRNTNIPSFAPRSETPSLYNSTPSKIVSSGIEDPLNTSLASYNFSYFRLPAELMPPPSPCFTPRVNFDFIPKSESDTTSLTSDAISDYAETEESDHAPVESVTPVHTIPAVAQTLATSIANPFAPPSSLPSSHSCSSLTSILNATSPPTSEGPKIKSVLTNQTSTAAKLATPTRIRIPNAKTSAWAFVRSPSSSFLLLLPFSLSLPSLFLLEFESYSFHSHRSTKRQVRSSHKLWSEREII